MPSGTPDEADKRIAALILRGALNKAEQAKEEGNSAYLNDDGAHGPGRVNERLLKGEINQVRSFNRRAGVDAASLPSLPEKMHDTPLQRETTALDRVYVQRAHQLRGSDAEAVASRADRTSCARDFFWDHERRAADKRGFDIPGGERGQKGACADFLRGVCRDDDCRFVHDPRDLCGNLSASRKRQRIGSGGQIVDIKAVNAEEERQADEDLELANPLLRGPTSTKKKKSFDEPEPKPQTKLEERRPKSDCWASKNLKVRIVDENGDFQRNHLSKGIIRCVDVTRACVDIDLEARPSKRLKDVPVSLLETVVSKSCRNVEIVKGPHRGMLGFLTCRDPKRNLAVVALGRGEDQTDIELQLDDVCEYA